MRFPFFRNRDSVKNGILISIRRTGDGFHPGLFIMQQKAHFVVSAYTSTPGNWSIPLMEQNPVLLFTASLRLQKRIIWIHSDILSICLIHWRIIRMIQIDHLLMICFRGLRNYREYAGFNNFWTLPLERAASIKYGTYGLPYTSQHN